MSDTKEETPKTNEVTKTDHTGMLLLGLFLGIPLLIAIVFIWYQFYFYPNYVN